MQNILPGWGMPREGLEMEITPGPIFAPPYAGHDSVPMVEELPPTTLHQARHVHHM